MDNPEEVYYNDLEEQYLAENAKFKVGDVVYFEHNVDDKHRMCVGIITRYDIKTYIRNTSKGESRFIGIVYDIVTPIELVYSVAECKITSAREFIYREHIYNNAE
jgi:hypothetical protein